MAQDEENLEPVLINSFLISSKRCRVYFRRNVLIWEMENHPFERHTIPVSDIISVDYGSGRFCNCLESRPGGDESFTFQDLTCTHSHNSMIIHYASRTTKNKWRISNVMLQHGDPRQVSSWLKTLDNAVKKENRPKSFLVFVNPFCGKRKGVEIYNKTVKPILELAKINIKLIITEYSEHSKDVILSMEMDKYDGILAVGGDGTVSEIMNALVSRTIKDENLNENDCDLQIPKIKIPVAIIPGGSTDCIAYCLNGTQDRKTAAIYAILGDRYGMDVCSVYSENGLCRYFLSLLGYGFLGDVLKESEKHRWMGPKRYDYSGFLKVLKNRRYYCEVSMILSAREAGIGPKCHSNCEICKESNITLESKERYQENRLSAIKNELKLNLNETSDRKVTVRGKYFIIGCANISCACERSPNGVAPHCHIGDGSMDVLLFKPSSLIDILRLLLRSKSKNENEALSDLPFIDIYKAKEMSIKVLDKNLQTVNETKDGRRYQGASVWNCDGEIVLDSNVRVKNYRQLVEVFTRRSMPPTKSDSLSCLSCYNCSK